MARHGFVWTHTRVVYSGWLSRQTYTMQNQAEVRRGYTGDAGTQSSSCSSPHHTRPQWLLVCGVPWAKLSFKFNMWESLSSFLLPGSCSVFEWGARHLISQLLCRLTVSSSLSLSLQRVMPRTLDPKALVTAKGLGPWFTLSDAPAGSLRRLTFLRSCAISYCFLMLLLCCTGCLWF